MDFCPNHALYYEITCIVTFDFANTELFEFFMRISITCSHCGKSFHVDGQYAGKHGKCPNPECHQAFTVPGDAEDSAKRLPFPTAKDPTAKDPTAKELTAKKTQILAVASRSPLVFDGTESVRPDSAHHGGCLAVGNSEKDLSGPSRGYWERHQHREWERSRGSGLARFFCGGDPFRAKVLPEMSWGRQPRGGGFVRQISG